MTEITYVEIPMRQLSHNAGHHKKNKKQTNMFLFTHRYRFDQGFSFLFFPPSETWFTRLKWIVEKVMGQEVST